MNRGPTQTRKSKVPLTREKLAMLVEESGDAGKGISTDFTDLAYWLDDLDRNAEWYAALRAIDEKGEKGPRCDLRPLMRLLMVAPPPASVRPHVEDLLERYTLKRLPGGAGLRTPSYDLSPAEGKLRLAKARVRDLIKGGSTVKIALSQVARQFDIAENTLADAYGGRRGASRRVKARSRRPA